MNKILIGLMFLSVPAQAVTVHVTYQASTVLHQGLAGSYAIGDQLGDPKLIKNVGEKGGVVILESIVALDENETQAATIHHFFQVGPITGADSAAINFTSSENDYIGRAVGSVLVDVGDYSVGMAGYGDNSTVVMKLKNGSTGLVVVTETLGAPAYTTGKVKFRYVFRNQ